MSIVTRAWAKRSFWVVAILLFLAISATFYLASITAGFLGIDLFGSSLGITQTDRVMVDFGTLRTSIPKNYFKARDTLVAATSPSPLYRHSAVLWTIFPSFEGYSNKKSKEFVDAHKDESPMVTFSIYSVAQPEEQLRAIAGQGALDDMLSKNGQGTQLMKVDADINFPGFDVYIPVQKWVKSSVYVLKNADELLIANCPQGPSPYCVVNKRLGATNVFVTYSFKKGLLHKLPELDIGLTSLVNSFKIQ